MPLMLICFLGIYCSHRLQESVPFVYEKKLFDSTWPHGYLSLQFGQNKYWISAFIHLQNLISMSGQKITSNPNIVSIDSLKRNCYFGHEHALKAHTKYSLVIVLISCKSSFVLFHDVISECMHVRVQHVLCPVFTQHNRQMHSLVLPSRGS